MIHRLVSIPGNSFIKNKKFLVKIQVTAAAAAGDLF
jgi:hypothetical protein